MSPTLHPDLGAIPVKWSFLALPESSDGQVRATIQKMIRYAREDSQAPIVQNLASELMAAGDGNPNLGLWRVLKPSMRFKKDEQIADLLPIEDPRIPDTVEVLIRPVDQAYLISESGRGVGDCDCFAMLGASLLTALRIPCSFVTVAVDPDQPGRFSHVYLASYWNGIRTPLDLSHGSYLGWECPNLGRLEEWPVNVTARDRLCDAALALGALAGVYFGLTYLGRAA